MHSTLSKVAQPTAFQAVDDGQLANVSPRDLFDISCCTSLTLAWGRFHLRRLRFLVLIMLAFVMPWECGLAAPEASAQAQNPPQTTTIQRTAPTEEPAPDSDSQEAREWGAQTWLALMAIVALLSFLVGRAWAPRPPTPAVVRKAVEDAFAVRRMNADVHSFTEAIRVLDQAQIEVLAALNKLKL